MPLGGRLERLEEDLFALYVPRVAVFDFFVQPRLECYVTRETEPVPCIKIVSKNCQVLGSPFVQSLNECFDFHVECRFTWPPSDEGTNGASRLKSRACYQIILSSLYYRVHVILYHFICYQKNSSKILHMWVFINAKAPTVRVNPKVHVLSNIRTYVILSCTVHVSLQ
jgi:hypothetical protein